MNRLILSALAIVVVGSLGLATPSLAQKSVPPKEALKLLGKSRAELETKFGKPTKVQTTTDGQPYLLWGEYPKATNACWNKDGTMTLLILQAAATWQKSLVKYGLSATGVHAKKIEGDGGSAAYALSGVKGLPAGWSCTWAESGLEFDRSRQ